jgi:hypothetical protein
MRIGTPVQHPTSTAVMPLASRAPRGVVGVSTVLNNRQVGQCTGVTGDFDDGVGG